MSEEITEVNPEVNELMGRLSKLDEFDPVVSRLRDFDPVSERQHVEKLFGKVGTLEQRLKEMGEVRKGALSDEDFAELSSEYPGLTPLLRKVLENVTLERRIVVDNDSTKVDFDSRLSELQAKLSADVDERVERRLLKRSHPDFDQIIKTGEWSKWVDTQPDDVKRILGESRDSDELIPIFTTYKKQLGEVKERESEKRKRLADALAPKATQKLNTQAVETDEDLFNKTLKSLLNR